VWAAAAVLLVAAVLGGGTWLSWAQRRVGAEAEARAALWEANRLLQEERWPEALSATRRAAGVLAGVGADANLQRQVEELGKHLEMAQRLQEARLERTAVKDGHFDDEAACTAFAEAFRWYGLDPDSLDPWEAGGRIWASPIHFQLLVALDHWAGAGSRVGGQGWTWAAAAVRTVDPDDWRNRLRDARDRRDSTATDALLASAPAVGGESFVGLAAGFDPREEAAVEQALPLLRQAQRRHPDDFWANHYLATYLRRDSQPPRLEEAIRYYTACVALRPRSSGARVNLGLALAASGDLDGAIAQYQEAIHLKADYAEAHNNLGNALRAKGRLHQAVAEYGNALRLKPGYAEAHSNLGNALADKRRLDEVFAEMRKPRKRYAAAAQFFEEAFTDRPAMADNMEQQYRYDAACAAALAGCGQGEDAADLEDQERARLRRQALDWLNADLGAWRKRLEKDPNQNRPTVAKTMQYWLADPDFTGVRGEAALGKLPEAERLQWQKLWEEVEALKRRAAGTPASPRPVTPWANPLLWRSEQGGR
jgi:tetratricopeptide (TPR) repeat protein